MEIKKCIWCSINNSETNFNDEAHTIPKSLGGKNICANVCDNCNHYYGNIIEQKPSIEETIKEVFYISRLRLLGNEHVGKNKTIPRIKSTYFNIDLDKNKLSLKTKFSLKKDFQNILCRQFKRGIYKIYLEEIERQKSGGFNPKYDFLKKFSRYNENDLPVFYFSRKTPLIITSQDWLVNPQINFEYKTMNYMIQNDIFFEFELFGQLFGIVIDENWEESYNEYIETNKKLKKEFFTGIIPITRIPDIDFSMNIFNQ